MTLESPESFLPKRPGLKICCCPSPGEPSLTPYPNLTCGHFLPTPVCSSCLGWQCGFSRVESQNTGPYSPARFAILLQNSFDCNAFSQVHCASFHISDINSGVAPPGNPPPTLPVKIDGAKVGEPGHRAGFVGQLFAWVFLTFSAYFGEGCLWRSFRADSWGIL